MARRIARVEMLVATLAIVVSLAALFVSVLEVNVMRSEVQLMRAQERAAVWPYVELTISYNSSGFAVEVINKGTGPALIRQVAVFDDAGLHYAGWPQIIDSILGQGHGIDWSNYLTSPLARSVLSPQEEMTAFRYPTDAWTEKARTLAKGMEALTWQVCYCSVLEDCWTRQRGQEPQPLEDRCTSLTPTPFED